MASQAMKPYDTSIHLFLRSATLVLAVVAIACFSWNIRHYSHYNYRYNGIRFNDFDRLDFAPLMPVRLEFLPVYLTSPFTTTSYTISSIMAGTI
jgi:hypothetical protein